MKFNVNSLVSWFLYDIYVHFKNNSYKFLFISFVLISILSCLSNFDENVIPPRISDTSMNKAKDCELSMKNDVLTIDIPIEYGSIVYEFTHNVSASKNLDVWRVNKAYAVMNGKRTPVSVVGEWECAIHLEGRPDFSGGLMHGDEIVQDIKFIIDGKEKIEVSSIKNFNTLSIIESSYLYDPSNESSVFAKHISEHRWNKNGMEILQTIEWLKIESVSSSYTAMFPASKDLFSQYKTNVNSNVQNLENNTAIGGVRNISLYGTRGVNSKFSITEFTTTHDYFLVMDNGGNAYWKCYFVAHETKPSIIREGTIWKSNAKYVIDIEQPRDTIPAANINIIKI